VDEAGFWLPVQALTEGYRISLGGASEQDAEATENLATHTPVLGVLMIATMILMFRSVRNALVLGGVAVMALGPALLSTWSIGFPISFNTILGTLGLIGGIAGASLVALLFIPGAYILLHRVGQRPAPVAA
jgi:Cu/Ag efflux pump CusA